MTGIPHLENQPPAPVRTLVANGEPLLPEGERLKAEKERVELIAEPLDRLEQRRQPLHPNEIAAKVENLKRRGVIKQPGRPPHAESRDELARQALAVVAGGEVILDIPDGVSLRKFSQRILNGLSKRADTRGYLWSVRDCGHHQVKLTCRGVDSKPAKMTAQIRREKRLRSPVGSFGVSTCADGGQNRSTGNLDAPAPIVAAEPEHEVGLDLAHSPAAVAIPSENPTPAVKEYLTTGQGATLRIEDIVPADPPEAGQLVDLMLAYHCGDWSDSSQEAEGRLMDNVNLQMELAQAIRIHRRAKAITDALMASWAEAWEFAGTEPPFADLAKRVHAALVDVLARAH
jgi:hypothetical protein